MTSEDGDVDEPMRIVCCHSESEQDIVDNEWNTLSAAHIGLIVQVSTQNTCDWKPFPTYQVVEVLDPLTFAAMWPLIGGVVSIFDATAAIVALWLFMEVAITSGR